MSSFPTVQLEGPRLMKQPTVPTIYQEQRTILPEANIQIAQGIDWESIGRNAANLGIEVVSKMREDEYETRVSALQIMQKDIANGIDIAAEINDWNRVEEIKRDYKNQTKNFLGGDIDDPNYIGSSLAERKLLSIARGFSSDIDANIEKGKKGWSDTLQFENYEKFRLSEQETLLNDPTYIDRAMENLDSMYRDLANSDINEPLNPVGYSINTRKLLYEIQKDKIDLLKAKEKLGGDPVNVQTAAEQARTKLLWASSMFANAKKLAEEADKLSEKPNRSQSENQEITRLRAEAAREAMNGSRIRASTMYGLVEQAKSDIVAGYPDDFVGPPEIPESLTNPISEDAISTLLEFNIKPADAEAIFRAFETQEEYSRINPEFKLARKYSESAVATLQQTVDSILSVAENNVKQIDAVLSSMDETDPRRVDLIIQRNAIIENTQKELYKRTLEPVLPPSFKANRRLLDFVDRGWFMAHIGPDKGVRYDEDQIDLVTFLTHDGYGAARDIYAYAQKKYNAFAGESARPTGGRGGGGGRSIEKERKDQRDTFALWTNQPTIEPLTSERTRELSIRGMISLVGTTPDGNLIPLMDAVKMYEEGKFKGPIPGNRDIFMQTPYFGQLIDLVRSSASVEEAQSIIDRVNKAFNADKVGEDIYPIPNNVIDSFMTLVRKGTQPNLTEQLFLMMPDSSRSLALETLKKDPEFDQLRLGRMQKLNDGYIAEGKRSAPKLYLQSVEEDPRYSGLVIAAANATVTAIRALPEKEGREETDTQKIARRNKEIIEEELVPKFLASFPQEFGVTQEMLSGNIQLRKSFYDRFLPTIVSSVSTSINPETGRIELSDNVDELVKAGVRKMVDSKWRWDKRSETWTTEEPTPQFVQTSIPKQRFEANAGPDIGEGNRLKALMLSEPTKIKLDDTSAKIIGATFSDYPNFTAASFKKNYDEDPYATLALLASKVSSVGNVTDEQMFSALRQITTEMPKDNLTLMSIAAASRMVSVDTLPSEYPAKLRTMTLQVREDILSGRGRFRAVTTNKPSRNPSERGSLTTTVAVFDGDKSVFEFQPQQYNYNRALDVSEKLDPSDLEKSIRDPAVDQKVRDRLVRMYFDRSGENEINIELVDPLLPRGVQRAGNKETRYYVDKKTNYLYRHDVGYGDPVRVSVMPKDFSKEPQKTKQEEFLKTVPIGRSSKNIRGNSYVLPKDARSVLIEEPVIPIDRLGIVPTAPVSKDNPVNAEIIRSKNKFYLVSKANLNIDQHFGVFGSVEDANRYLEALKEFVDNQ